MTDFFWVSPAWRCQALSAVRDHAVGGGRRLAPRRALIDARVRPLDPVPELVQALTAAFGGNLTAAQAAAAMAPAEVPPIFLKRKSCASRLARRG